MKRARFVAPARREFLREVAYYNRKEVSLGARFTAAVEEATLRAIAFPLTGSRASKNTRRVFVNGFPFAVVYRPESDGIVVLPTTQGCRSIGSHEFASANAASARLTNTSDRTSSPVIQLRPNGTSIAKCPRSLITRASVRMVLVAAARRGRFRSVL